MGAEFNWWLLIVGVVVGGVVTWLVMADSNRREQEVDDRELPAEAAWIARYVGQPKVDADVATQVLRAHHTYLGFPPPDVLVSTDELAPMEPSGPPSTEPGGDGEQPAVSAEDPVVNGEQAVVSAEDPGVSAEDPGVSAEDPAAG